MTSVTVDMTLDQLLQAIRRLSHEHDRWKQRRFWAYSASVLSARATWTMHFEIIGEITNIETIAKGDR